MRAAVDALSAPRSRARTARPGLARAGALLVLAVGGVCAAPADAAVVIRQVYGGGGNTGAPYHADFVELRNTGAAAVDLGGWSLQYASATGATWGGAQLTVLSGSIASGGSYLVRLAVSAASTAPALPAADAVGTTAMSATAGKVALVRNATALAGACPLPSAAVADFVGYGATASCFEGGGPAPAPSNTTALLRAGGGCTDSGDNAADFATAAPAPRNSTAGPQACDTVAPGGAASAAIHQIQGSGATSPLAGRAVATRGVVTRRTSNGFFVQDPTGDGDPATSDGLFVFTGSTVHTAAAVGNLVAVTGTVVEFNTGAASNAQTAARTVTQLSAVSAVELQGTGYTVAPVVFRLPEAFDGELERVEGMLVTLTGGPFTVAQNFFQGRYGQLTLAVGGRLETPTNRFRPGPQAAALADENARRRIVLDDGSTLQNPAPTPYLGADALPRAGDLVTGTVTGVVDYGLATNSNTGPGDDKIHPTAMPTFAVANPRTATPPPVGGNLRVGSFNVLNFFTTFTDGSSADGRSGQGCSLGASVAASNCRGADSPAEFERQRAKIVAALAALDADVVGLMEIQNNGNAALDNLLAALNARVGAGSYAGVALPAGGTGTDAIRVALIYRPARAAPVGAPVSDPDPVHNRPPLAQTFALASGERFTVVVNHFKSKGSCPAAGDADAAGNVDSGDGQGCWNALRVLQATRLATFAAQLRGPAGTDRQLLIGDFNAYAQEDPIVALATLGFADLVGRFAPGGYSYVFDGAVGRLDHALASASFAALVTGATHWPVNADETALADYNLEFKAPRACGALPCPADPYQPTPYRASDHDPVVVGAALLRTVVAGAGDPVVTGGAGDDLIVSGAGRRTLTGGGGHDVFRFTAGFAGGATITDFDDGDRLDLAAVLRALGIVAADPIGQGHVGCTARGADALVTVDPDAAGPAAARPLILLQRRSCGAALRASGFVF